MSNTVPKRLRTYGPKVGRCNICDSLGVLTDDHVPPKGSTEIQPMQVDYLIDTLRAQHSGKARISQNGVKFRSICADCNNDLLGAKYDVALNDFTRILVDGLGQVGPAHGQARITCNPLWVAKAVAGHILSLGIERQEKGDVGEALARFVLDPRLPLPDRFSMYYWVFLGKHQVVIRDALLSFNFSKDSFFFSCLKYRPIAFMICYEKQGPFPYLVNDLTPFLSEESRNVEVPLFLVNAPRFDFPEGPDSQSMVMYVGEGAVGAIPHRKK